MSKPNSVVFPIAVPLLGAGVTWTREGTLDRQRQPDIWRRVRLEAFFSQACTIYVEESDDSAFGSDTDILTVTVAANTSPVVDWANWTKKYLRIRIVNGGDAQTSPPILLIEFAGRLPIDTEEWGEVGSTPVGMEQITVDNTVKTLTVPAGATRAKVFIEDAEQRLTVDGTLPSTTVGALVFVGDVIKLNSPEEMSGFKITRATATSGAITVLYGK